MTLLEHVDPILERVCVLNRAGSYAAASSSRLSIHEVRQEFMQLLDAAREKALKDPMLTGEYPKIEENLVVFIDNILGGSDLPFSAEWDEHRLAHGLTEWPCPRVVVLPGESRDQRGDSNVVRREILNGEDRFFEAVRSALKDPGANVRDRLLFYYVCLGLGFAERGPLGEDERRQLQARLKGHLESSFTSDLSTRICPDAYENVDTSDYTRTLHTPLRWTVVATAAALVAAIGLTWFGVNWKNAALDREIDKLKVLTGAFEVRDEAEPDVDSEGQERAR